MIRKKKTNYNIVLVGSPETGKSSLISQFKNSKINLNYIETIGVNEIIDTVEFNNVIINIRFSDVAGQNEFFQLGKLYLFDANLIIVLYDLTRPETLFKAEEWCQTIRETCDNIFIALIGNKKDLINYLRNVDYFYKKFNINYNNFVSAKTGENVNEPNKSMIHDVIFQSALHKNELIETNKKCTKCLGKICLYLKPTVIT